MLEIKHLSKSYNRKKILDDITVSVKHGEIAVFLGSSGVGKSTLLRILNNLETYETGTFTLDHRQLNISLVNQTHTVGMVFQHFNLFDNMSVVENITFPLIKAAHKKPLEAAAIAHELLVKYGLEDKALLSIHSLSGGQKQRLALARTLALKPKVLCLDEPTSALDPQLTNFVAQSIQDLARQNYIVLVATHDVSLLEQLSCTIYLMHAGKIIEQAHSEEYKLHKTKYPSLQKFIEGT